MPDPETRTTRDAAIEAAAKADFIDNWSLGGTTGSVAEAEAAWNRSGEVVRDGYRQTARVVLAAGVPVVLDEIERQAARRQLTDSANLFGQGYNAAVRDILADVASFRASNSWETPR